MIAILLLFLNQCLMVNHTNPSQHLTLNGEWKFCVDSLKAGEAEGYIQNGIPGERSRVVTVPHTWNIDDGLEEYCGLVWYEKSFMAPGTWLDKKIRIRFDGVFHTAVVWLNGFRIGEHAGSGYTPFVMNLSERIREGNNRLMVAVNNEFTSAALPYEKSFDWADDGGIYRNVTLLVTGRPAIDYVLVQARPEQVGDRTDGILTFKIAVLDVPDDMKSIPTMIKVSEENIAAPNPILTETRNGLIQNEMINLTCQLKNIKLWHFDTPTLYKVEIDLHYNDQITDTYVTSVGFRSIEVRQAKIFLNGEPVRLAGIEWMPGSNPHFGMAEPPAEIERHLENLKKLNCTFTRFHWQQDESVFDWCDRNGILVQEEIPLWGNGMPSMNQAITELAKNQASEMVVRHYNHPSIIAWGVGNEHYGHEKGTQEYVKTMYDYIKALDPGRLVNYVSNTVHFNPAGDATTRGDIIMWNEYFETWFGQDESSVSPALDSIHAYHPDKPVVISEYGLCEPVFKGGDRRRIEHMISHTRIYGTKPYVAGCIYFCYNDYRTFIGEQGSGKYRERVHGVYDLQGHRKASADSLSVLFAPIRIAKTEVLPGNKIKVFIVVNNTLPAFTVNDYTLLLTGDPDGQSHIDSVRLPSLAPGQEFLVTFHLETEQLAWLIIRQPNGYIVWRQKAGAN